MKHLLIAAITVAALTALCSPAAAAQEVSPQVKEMFQQGWALERQMHKDVTSLDRAQALYEEAVKQAPESDEARWRMGEILFKKGDVNQDEKIRKELYLQALDYSLQAIALKPDSVGGLYWAGCSNGRLAEMVGILSALGRVKDAKKYLLATIEADPNHRFSTLSYAILGVIYASTPWPMKDMDKALEYAGTAVQRDPNLTMASLNLAKVYAKGKQYEKAREELKRCLSIEKPTYIWDSELKDWPQAKELMAEIEEK